MTEPAYESPVCSAGDKLPTKDDETSLVIPRGRHNTACRCTRSQRGSGQLLIHTTASLVSAGTERKLVELGKSNWLDKARQRPDKVRMVLDKVRTDGLAVTVEAVRSKLDQPWRSVVATWAV